MKVYYALLLALTRLISVTNGQLNLRAPVPGVISVPYFRSSSQLEKRGGTVNVPMGATLANYMVNITAGTPPQPITLSLDTGSSDTIVVTHESAFCAQYTGYCPSVGYYNANKSSTYKYISSDFSSNFGVKEGGGSGADGDVATDTFTMGGATLKNQQFAIAYGNFTIAYSLLGLGYAAGENQVHADPPLPQYNNFPLTLAAQGATNLALFSLWKDAVDSHDGQLLFGGIDTTKYIGNLTTLKTQKRRPEDTEIYAFDVLINGVGYNGAMSEGSVSTVLDCGSPDAMLPDNWVKPIYDELKVTYTKNNDTAYIDCALRKSKSTVDFQFGSLKIKVPMSYMVSLRSIDPDVCTFGIIPAGDRHPLLGDNFLSSAYAVFDLTNDEISLAARDFSSTTDNVVVVPAGGVKAIGAETTKPSSTGTGTGSDTTEPSSTETGTGTGTGSEPDATETKKSGASTISFPAALIGISLLGIFSLGSFF